jgi:anti-sigma-K factor RskA
VRSSPSPFEAHPLDDLAVHAVDALDGPERRALGVHLDACPACRAELDALRATAARLVRPEAPPPRVWARIATDLPHHADGTLPAVGPRDLAGARGGAGAGEPVPGPGRRHLLSTSAGDRGRAAPGRWQRWSTGVLAAAAALAVLAGVVGFVAGRAGRVGDGGSSPDVVALAEAALADPGNPRVALTDGRGDQVARVVTGDRSGEGYVVLDAVDRLPEGRTYQLWRLDGPSPVSLGVLGDGATAALAVPLPAPLGDDPARLAITSESAPGASSPSGPLVAQGTLPATPA